jgi:hypothetical protein
MLLPSRPELIIQPDFSGKDASDVDKELQLLAKQDFTVEGTKKRLRTRARMLVEYHQDAMEMAMHIAGKPEIINEISRAMTQDGLEHGGRPKKGTHSHPENSEAMQIYRSD